MTGTLQRNTSREVRRPRVPPPRTRAILGTARTPFVGAHRALGRTDSATLALQLMASLQGVSLLAQSFRDPRLIETGAARLTDWLAAL